MSKLSIDFQIHLLAESSILHVSDEAMIAISFELLAERLQALERLYFEMDGSFVWTGSIPCPWQVDGMVYDRGQQIQRIELKGQFPWNEWNMLLEALNHPLQSLVAYDLKATRFMTLQQLESSLWSA